MNTNHELENFTGRWRGKYYRNGNVQKPEVERQVTLFEAQYLSANQVAINLGLVEGKKTLAAVVKPVIMRELLPNRINGKNSF